MPFPLTVLNLLFGSIVLGAKSPLLNSKLLHIYFLPVFVIQVCVFLVYQIIIFIPCYLKVVGHKWALVVNGPIGRGSVSPLDRAGQCVVFFAFGPFILLVTLFTDLYWFSKHVYITDLESSNSSRAFIET